VTEDKEQQAMKDNKKSVVQNLTGEKDLSPSSLVRRQRRLLQTLMGVGESPRSVVKECNPVRKFMNYMVLMSRIIDVEPSIS
jgi:hypothetical protein